MLKQINVEVICNKNFFFFIFLSFRFSFLPFNFLSFCLISFLSPQNNIQTERPSAAAQMQNSIAKMSSRAVKKKKKKVNREKRLS